MHGDLSPISGTVVTLKTGRREVRGSNPGRACRDRDCDRDPVALVALDAT